MPVIVACFMLEASGCCLLMLMIFSARFLEVLDCYCATDYDLITFRATSADSETLVPMRSRQSDFLGFDVTESIDAERLKYRNDVPWAKMVSRNIVQKHSIQFDETLAGNDVMFSYYLDYYARNVAICSVAIYCATIREGSLQYSVLLDNLLARVWVACRCNRFLRKINREDRLVSSYYRVMQCRKYFGRRGYYKALWIFICNEQWNIVYGTFRGVFMDKMKNICEKLKLW